MRRTDRVSRRPSRRRPRSPARLKQWPRRGPAVCQIAANRGHDRHRQRHELLLASPLALDPRVPATEIRVVEIQAAQFADPQPEAEEHQHDRVVAGLGFGVAVRRVEQPLDLLDRRARRHPSFLALDTRHFQIPRPRPNSSCEFLGRREGPNPNGSATLISLNILETEIEVGHYRTPLVVALRGFGGVWKECAEETVKELRAWVESIAKRLTRIVSADPSWI